MGRRRRNVGIAVSLALGMVGLLWCTNNVEIVPKATAATGINQQINFQGRLFNAAGNVVADGTYNMRFKIYCDGDGVPGSTGTAGVCQGHANNENLFWTEAYLVSSSQGVTVRNGYFSVPLGSLCALSGGSCQGNTNTALDFNQDELYLSIDIGGTANTPTPTYDGEMNPMKRLTSTPYALNAGLLDGLDSAAFAQLAANQTFTGANTFQPAANAVALTVKQNAQGSPTADILNIQTQNSTAVIQATGPALNEAALLLQSVGATRDVTINSGSGVVLLGSNVSFLRRSAAALTIDLSTNGTSTLSVSNSNGSNVANLSVEGTVAVGSFASASSTPVCSNGGVLSTCNANAGGVTLNDAYTAGGSAAITMTTGRDLTVNAADVATDPSVVIDLQCTTCSASGGRFAVQNASTDVFVVNPNSGNIVMAPAGAGDIVQTLDANSNMQITASGINANINPVTIGATYTGDQTSNAFDLTVTNNSSASTGTLYGLNVNNADNGGNTGVLDALARFINSQATETVPDGVLVQNNPSSGTLTSGLRILQNTAGGTMTHGIQIQQNAGTLTNGLTFTGTFSNLINSTNFSVTNAGAITAVGANVGSGLLQGSGGLTVTGAVSINTTGTANTAVGNGTGTLALTSNAFNLTTAGAVSGVTTLSTSGIITVGALGAATSATSICRNASNQISSCGTNPDAVSLQDAYAAGGSATITMTTGRDLSVVSPDVATDPSFLFNTQCTTCSASGGRFAVQNAGTDVFTISPNSGNVTIAPAGAGDVVNTLDADTNLQVTATAVNAAINPLALSATYTGDVTSNAADIAVTYNVNASTGTLYALNVVNNDNAGSTGVIDAIARFINSQATETIADGVLVQNNPSSGTMTSGLRILQNTAGGTMTNGIQIQQNAGTLSNGLTFTGTFTTLINSTNFSVSNAGAVTAVGVNVGSGLLQGNGGATITGAVSLNTTGTANTAIGNGTGTLALTSSAFNLTTAGAVSGVTTLSTSGIITVGALGAATTPASICRNASNQISSCGTNPDGVTLQDAYAAGGSAAITMTTGRDLSVVSPDVATDPSFLFNTQCTTCSASGGRFAVQNAGTDVFTVAPNSGNITIAPAGAGDVVATLNADTNLQVTATAVNAAIDPVEIAVTYTGDVTSNATDIGVTYNVNASTGTAYALNVANNDNTGSTGVIDAIARFLNSQATETIPDGVLVQNNPSSGTMTSGLRILQNTAGGTMTNGIQIQNNAGTLTNGLTFTGTFTNMINSTTFTVSNAGAVTAVGVNSGSGLLQGTGGLTLTGAVLMNTTGTANTSIGNGTGTLALTSNAFNVTTAGAVTGVTTLVATTSITAPIFRTANQTAGSTPSVAANFGSGNASGATSATGAVTLSSGNSTTSGNTGDITIVSGNATSGNSGNISIDSGTSSATEGTITIGAANANSIQIGRSSGTNAATTINGTILHKPVADVADAWVIQNTAGSELISLDTRDDSANLIPNASFEQTISTWALIQGTTTITRATSEKFFQTASMQLAIGSGGAFRGAKYPITLSNGTYALSFYAREDGADLISGLVFGYSDTGTNTNIGGSDDCVTVDSYVDTIWERYTCTFTVSGTSGTPFIYIASDTNSASTVWVDGITLIPTATDIYTEGFYEGLLDLSGVAMSGPVTIQNAGGGENDGNPVLQMFGGSFGITNSFTNKAMRIKLFGSGVNLDGAATDMYAGLYTPGTHFAGDPTYFWRANLANKYMYIGDGIGTTTPTQLILADKNDAGDPSTTQGGAMYYNSNSGRMRCREAGVWKNCTSPSKATATRSAVSAASNTSSGTYVDMPSPSSLSVTKDYGTLTDLVVTLHFSMWSSVASTVVTAGILVDGTTYDCMTFFFNTANQHDQLSCTVLIPSLSAGSKTVQARWKRTSGTGVLNMDTNDWTSITAIEME